MSEADARKKALRGTRLAAETSAVKDAKPSVADTKARAAGGETLAAYVERWCVDRERRGNTSVQSDRGRLSKWILPYFERNGVSTIADISKVMIERFVEHIDSRVGEGELSWRTAQNVWTLVTKLFDDATNAKTLRLRVLEENPALTVRGPDKGLEKSKVYLFPSEFQKLVSCSEIPIRWRCLYALATYLYARAAEIRGLEWTDVDLEHGIVFIHRTVDDDGKTDSTKGNASRRFKLEPELVPLLTALKKGAPGAGRVFDPLPTERYLAPMLRRDLKRAGVTRAELFANDKTRKQMTFHDLRSTGITWMAVRGDEPLKIQHRAGHKQFSTTSGYIREAEHVRDGFGTPFSQLPDELRSSRVSSERLGRNGHVYKIERGEDAHVSQPALTTKERRTPPKGGGV